MDALDGGPWQYGDDSFPAVGVTYFAGTFVRHPMALAATRAVLNYLKEQGKELQKAVNRKAELFARRLNDHFRAAGAPMNIGQFGSPHENRFYERMTRSTSCSLSTCARRGCTVGWQAHFPDSRPQRRRY